MANPYPHLFSPLTLRSVTLRNRIVSTSHGTFMSKNGLPTERIAAYHAARAAGGAGLINLEATSIHETAIGAGLYATAHTDDCIAGYRTVVEAIHAHGCPVFGQLYHPGREDIAGSSDDGTIAVCYAPSPVPAESVRLMPRPLPRALILALVEAYGQAAERLVAAGVDGIEVMAHDGHLVSQFLNPRVNRRDDDYGGSFENRTRFVRQIIGAVRRAVGSDAPLGVRVSGADMDADGLTGDETVAICRALDGLGEVDYFSVMLGAGSSYQSNSFAISDMAVEAGLVLPYAAAVKAAVSTPVLVTERINRPAEAERIIAEGQADLCGMTRAQICDPELANKAREGRDDDIRVCIACNQACIAHGGKGVPVSCIQHPESGRELVYETHRPATKRRRVLVAGGGPAGMKAAVVAAERGHDVVLVERAERLGGQALLAQLLPGRAEFGGLATNLAREVERAGVEVRTGTEVTRAMIDGEAPDAVIVATGARSWCPEIAGADDAHVVDAWQVLRDEVNVGASVVVADATLEWTGMGIAEKLVRAGSSVRLCVIGDMAGETLPSSVRNHWAGVLHGLGVQVRPLLRLAQCADDAVGFIHTCSGEPVIEENVDTLVVVQGRIQESALEDALADYDGDVRYIGDCLAPRTAEEAVLEGLKAGWSL